MKKILLSLSMIVFVGAVVIGATGAFFSDTETSTGNTFTAGAIDLTVDSQQHYNGMVCVLEGEDGEETGTWQPETGTVPPYYPAEDSPCDGTWEATDLGVEHQFFDFHDVKPGDSGEDTISLHINNNDAWLRLIINAVTNDGNGLTEPEDVVDNDADGVGQGELRENLLFSMWLDQGVNPGFQGPQDLSECDNDHVAQEPMIISEGTIDANGETWNLKDYNGLYLKGGETACFGVNWRLPSTVGNETQTDSMSATMEFQVVQHRNNPSATF